MQMKSAGSLTTGTKEVWHSGSVLYPVFLWIGCDYIAGSKNKIHFGTVLCGQYGPNPSIRIDGRGPY